MMLHHKRFTSLSFFDIVTSCLSWFPKANRLVLISTGQAILAKLVGPQRAPGGGILVESIPKRMVILCTEMEIYLLFRPVVWTKMLFNLIKFKNSKCWIIMGYSSLTDCIYIIYQPPANAAGLCWAWDCKQHGQKHHQEQQQQQQHHSLHCQQHGEKHHQKQQQQQQQPTAAITTATTTTTATTRTTTTTTTRRTTRRTTRTTATATRAAAAAAAAPAGSQQLTANSQQEQQHRRGPRGIEPETFWMWGGRGACACGGGGGGVWGGGVKSGTSVLPIGRDN